MPPRPLPRLGRKGRHRQIQLRQQRLLTSRWKKTLLISYAITSRSDQVVVLTTPQDEADNDSAYGTSVSGYVKNIGSTRSILTQHSQVALPLSPVASIEALSKTAAAIRV